MSTLSVALGLTRALPLGPAIAAGRLMLFVYLALTPGVRAEIADNRRRFSGQVEAGFWLRQAWRLGRNLALMSQGDRPTMQKFLDNAYFTGENTVEQIMLAKGRAVVLSMHFGLWELLPSLFARKGFRVCVGVGNQMDPAFGSALMQLRGESGIEYTSSLDRLRNALREGALTGFVLDNTSRTRRVGCDELWPGFKLLRTPFVLADSEQAALVPMFVRWGQDRIEVTVEDPVATPKEFGTLARKMIEEYPEDWVFWGKNEVSS